MQGKFLCIIRLDFAKQGVTIHLHVFRRIVCINIAVDFFKTLI